MWLVFLRNWVFNCVFSLLPVSSPLATISLFSVSITLFLFCYVHSFVLILYFYISEIISCFSFSVWLISLSIISSRSIYVIANGKISLSFYGWIIVHHNSLKSGSTLSPALFFFFKMILAIQSLFTHFIIICSSSMKNAIGILMEIALNLYIALLPSSF